MALTSQGWRLVLNMKDSGNNLFTKRLEFIAADAAEAATRASNFLTAWGGVSGCVITSYHYYEQYEEDAFAFPSNVEGENQAELYFSIDGAPQKTATLAVPGIVGTAFVDSTGPNRNVIDTTDADIVTLEGQFTSGIFKLSDGETMDDLLSGKRVHIKNRKG